jgi:thiol:disulfide interchange protein
MAPKFTDRLLLFLGIAALIAAAAIIILRSSSTGHAPTPPLFSEALTLEQATQRAERENKPIFIVVTATWCGPCQSYKRATLSKPEVEAAIRAKAIPVILDADTDQAAIEPLHIMSIPVTILLRDGKEVSRLCGRAAPDEVLTWLDKASDK